MWQTIVCVLLATSTSEVYLYRTNLDNSYTRGSSSQIVNLKEPARTPAQQMPGWPKINAAPGMSYSQPVLSDVTGDGICDIIYAYYGYGVDYVNILQHDGSAYGSWPKQYPGPQSYMTPVTADIDGDGDLEIFGGGHVSGDASFLARHHVGAPVSGWPVVVDNVECSPIVFDLDDDGLREVLVGDNLTPGDFLAFRGNGAIAAEWPLVTTAGTMVNSAAVADVDGDGDIEIAPVVADGTVNLWTLDGVALRRYLVDWGAFYHDNWNTGWVHPRPPVNLSANTSADTVYLSWGANSEPDIAGYNVYRSDVTGGPYEKISGAVVAEPVYVDLPGVGTYYYCVTAQIHAVAESRLSNEVSALTGVSEGSNYGIAGVNVAPNPFRHTLTFSSGLTNELKIRIYDASGSLVDEISGQGIVVWRAEESVAQGVYFADIETGGQELIQKIIKLR